MPLTIPSESVGILELRPTARVVWMDCYGTAAARTIVLWAEINDDRGRRAFVCLDCRERSATRCRLFDRAMHPSQPTATLIELGEEEEEEGIAISLMSSWLDSEEPVREGLLETGIELMKRALLRLGEPVDE